MRDLGQRYVQSFNRHYGRSGTLWEGRYRSFIAESARYVMACYRYIELNPVDAGMVAAPADYPWSSYAANTGTRSDRLVTAHPEYLALGNDAERYGRPRAPVTPLRATPSRPSWRHGWDERPSPGGRGGRKRRRMTSRSACRKSGSDPDFRGLKSGMAQGEEMSWANPIRTDGFEFVEYAAPDPAALGGLFERLGFQAVARHRHKNVLLYKQGDVNFIVNAEPRSFAQNFARRHGPSVCAMAFRVRDAASAYDKLIERGAWGVESRPGPGELSIPAIKGIGDSLVYLVDRYPENDYGNTIYDVDFKPLPGFEAFWRGGVEAPRGVGLAYVDHLTHNVHRGRMQEWAEFYERLFNFREIRYFDIEGKLTGLKSKAMTSPCGKIRIPINESSDDRSQIQEYLEQYHGEGIQHIALHATDIYDTVDRLRGSGVDLLDTPDTYYEMLEKRLPGHGEPVEELQKRKILIDGSPSGGLLLQIFTKTMIGPIFFEIIQRKGDEGFGEGNFKALFESMELDQVRRGVLKPAA
jgi:4-hydroxyphenylpyruvate dioxygenase